MNDHLKYWLALNRIEGLGPVTVKKLYDHFQDIGTVWYADEKRISMIEGLNKPAIKAFLETRGAIDLDRELERLGKVKAAAITLEDDSYPPLLRDIYDPPPVLFIKGELVKADEKTIAIVGTRKASRYGLETARQLAQELAARGITIISGLADGIDTAAHTGALDAKGRTIAVFGCGVDVIFPSGNRTLAARIERSGALVSEYPLGSGPEKGNFPRRNRIISGLSLGVIMVEGHYDSGAMITAKQALDQGREVFAVPGPIGLESFRGPHWLIKQGAKLVENVEDVVDELKLQFPGERIPKAAAAHARCADLSPEEKRIYAVLGPEPKHIDEVAGALNMPVGQLAGQLTLMEIKGAVRQLSGKMFSLY